MENIFQKGISAIGIIAVVNAFVNLIRRKEHVRNYFKNKVVLITGASSGLGAALAEELYPFGCQLILCARRIDELNKVKQRLIEV